MKKRYKFLLILIGLIILLIFGGFLFLNTLAPTYEGEHELEGISDEVEVYFDAFGIPHIYAENESDALTALGYVHAQDRLWQMELLRRAGSGGLSEIFGEVTLETDKFFLSLGIDEYNEANLASMDPNDPVLKLSKSYLKGINQFIESGPTPVEFYLTGLEKSPFEIKDVMNAVAYMGFTFNKGARDIVNTNLLGRLDSVYTAELFEENPNDAIKIPFHQDSSRTNLVAIHEKINTALENLPIPEIYGSNSWVLAPEKTATGAVLFENDPHIAQAQPSVWYEAHLVTPNYEKYGYYLAGVPFPLLAHNRKMAHGLTMLANDDTNFYYEENHPTDSTLYRFKDEWKKYVYVTKTIKVKEVGDVEFQYKKTHRGPIVNANYANRTRVSGETPVSMHWIYTQFDNQMLHGLFELNHANTIYEFEASLPKIHAPGLNVMYGDAEGNVAWWGTAKLYRMPDRTSTKFILNGASGEDDPLEYLDFSKNPRCINPPQNYVYSANNQPDSTAAMFVPGYFSKSWHRAGRIVDTMNEKQGGWTRQDMADLANDVELRTASEFLIDCLSVVDVDNLNESQLEYFENLLEWDGTFGLKSTGGVFYEKFRDNLHRELFADEFDSMEEYYSYGSQLKLHKVFKNADSAWWDNVSTTDTKESKSAILATTFELTWKELKAAYGDDTSSWTWDRVHFLEHDHPIGRVESLRKYFNVGPFPSVGTGETLNNQGFRTLEDGSYKVTSIPSTRRIIDFSDIENSISILPTGQSGNPLSKHYKDQAEMYVNGEFRKMMMNEQEIKANSVDKLILTIKN